MEKNERTHTQTHVYGNNEHTHTQIQIHEKHEHTYTHTKLDETKRTHIYTNINTLKK